VLNMLLYMVTFIGYFYFMQLLYHYESVYDS